MSRVMSGVIIYLGRLSPIASSDQPETSGPHTFRFGLASDGVYRDPCCYQQSGGLLHHLSTLTTKSRARTMSCVVSHCGGIFLLHFPWSHLHLTLSGILPCEARTFLTCCLSALAAAITCLTPFLLLYGCRLWWLSSHVKTTSPDKLAHQRIIADIIRRNVQEII